MRRGALIAAAIGLGLLWAPPASAETVFGTDGCTKSQYKPARIALTCADGRVQFRVQEWASWGGREALAYGVLTHPDLTAPGRCQERTYACPWAETEATATFFEPVRCLSNNRLQFRSLLIEAPTDPDPELRRVEQQFSCSQYPPALRLGTRKAARYMRTALLDQPELSFADAYARKVRCNKRISAVRVRCKMSWNFGDTYFDGRGMVWLRPRGGGWSYAYRVRKRNAYCEATGGGDCVDTITVR